MNSSRLPATTGDYRRLSATIGDYRRLGDPWQRFTPFHSATLARLPLAMQMRRSLVSAAGERFTDSVTGLRTLQRPLRRGARLTAMTVATVEIVEPVETKSRNSPKCRTR